MDTKKIIREVSATTLGLGGLVGFSLLNIPLLASGLAGVGIYTGVKLLTSPGSTKKIKIDLENLNNDLATEIIEIEEVLVKLSKQSKQLKNNSIKDKIQEIVDFGYKLVEVLSDEKNATNLLREVQKLFANLEKMFVKYLQIENHKEVNPTEKQQELTEDFENLLDKLKITFRNYYQKGVRSDLQDFEVEMKLVESKIDRV